MTCQMFPQFQNDDLWGGIWVLGDGRSHKDSDWANKGVAEPLEYPFWSKICSWRWQCDRKPCCDAASKCPQSQAGTMNPFSELFKDLMIVPIILTVKCWSDLMTALTLVTFSSIFDVQGVPKQGSSSTLSWPSKNALCHLKTYALDMACSP
jgi:hypothetical protein